MPTFEFQFRREFAAQDAPRIEIEAESVHYWEMSQGRLVVEALGRSAVGDTGAVFSTPSDRLLWWRPLPEEDDAKKAATGAPPPPPPSADPGIDAPT